MREGMWFLISALMGGAAGSGLYWIFYSMDASLGFSEGAAIPGLFASFVACVLFGFKFPLEWALAIGLGFISLLIFTIAPGCLVYFSTHEKMGHHNWGWALTISIITFVVGIVGMALGVLWGGLLVRELRRRAAERRA